MAWRSAVSFPDYKFGKDEIKIPVEQYDMMQAHIGNFLQCMRTREKPHLDVETAAHAQVLISLAVESYRDGRVRYWDEKSWKSKRSSVQGLNKKGDLVDAKIPSTLLRAPIPG